MKNPLFDNTPRWRQSLLQLTRIVTIETRRRLMCIPHRQDAKEEANNLRRQYGEALTDVRISKNGKGPTATFTCSYTLRETRTEELF